jgi:isoleucyl-tRNA synthetase
VHIQLPAGASSQVSSETSSEASSQESSEASSPSTSDAFGAEALQAIGAVLAASACPAVDNLADWLLVSELRLGGEPPQPELAQAEEGDLTLRVARAAGEKCERCWHHETDVRDHSLEEGVQGRICGRCRDILDRDS